MLRLEFFTFLQEIAPASDILMPIVFFVSIALFIIAAIAFLIFRKYKKKHRHN